MQQQRQPDPRAEAAKTAARQVQDVMQSPRLGWLVGFRSGVWWKRVVASVVYLFLLVAILVDLGRGDSAWFLWAVVLAAIVVLPVIVARQQAANGLLTFRVHNAAVFPDAILSLPEDDIWDPWPDLLRDAHRRQQHVLVVPMVDQRAASYGTEALVTQVAPLFQFQGLRRVQITRTVGAGSGQARRNLGALSFLFLPALILNALTSTRSSTKPAGAVFRCRFAPLTDRVSPAADAQCEDALRIFRRVARSFPDGSERLRELEADRDARNVANRLSQMLLQGPNTGALAVTHLSSDDVEWRLRSLAQIMQSVAGDRPGETVPDFEVEAPDRLPTLAAIGGMEDLKRQLRETVGLVVEHPEVVERMGINFNGVLMYGPPGTGKTFTARATAGEYQMNFLHLTGGDLASKYMGESEKYIQAAFRTAAANRPCLLFFDEFDSVAGKRGESAGNEQFQKMVVGQLLKSLEDIRHQPGVIVMAATNDIDGLDDAVVRPGRFDQKVRVDLPDPESRRSIFKALLRALPTIGDLKLDDLVLDTEGRSAADIAAIVEGAKLKALKRAVSEGSKDATLTQADLEGAFQERRGKETRTLRKMTWDDLILPAQTKRQLQQLAAIIADPRALRELGGHKPPTGALLFGPPGTGKTTIARVIASETRGRVSFIDLKGSDLVSPLQGESARNLRDVFQRARQNSPTILFIDELEALLPARDARPTGGEGSSLVTEFLQQLDGIDSVPGSVFVLGATNLRDKIDPAVLRGGRLGIQIEVPLPTQEERVELLKRHSRELKLADDVDFVALSKLSERFSGAALEEICQEAVANAFQRNEGPRAVTQADFMSVLRRRRPVHRVEKRGWDEVILPPGTKAELRNLAEIIKNPLAGEGLVARPTGALLYGPPGTGKTTIAQVLASQLEGDVGFWSVKGSDLVSKFVGDGARNVRELFEKARAQTPSIIFIDEIEALVPKRGSEEARGPEAQALITEFLQQLDGIDSTPGVFVLAATNLPDRIDPAMLRGGRISQRIEIPLPTLENRVQLFQLQAQKLRFESDVDFESLARQTERFSGADIEGLCQEAGQIAYQRQEGPRAITQADFIAALRRRRSVAHVEQRSWDDLVLPSETLSRLQGLARQIADPEAGREFGLKPPKGAILYGPPGTGKTSVARVLASQLAGDVSFFSIKGSDIMSKWVGESGQNVRSVFEKARSQTPAMIFIDEIEALLPARGQGGGGPANESVVTEFLQQLDGIESGSGVFVLGATNLLERIDPAVLRGGRLGDQIEIPLPNRENREELFKRNSSGREIAPGVDFEVLAQATDGLSGADIESICNDAAQTAFMRGEGPRQVTGADYESALARYLDARRRPPAMPPIGLQ